MTQDESQPKASANKRLHPDKDATEGRLAVDEYTSPDDLRRAVENWVAVKVPDAWVKAGNAGGPGAVRKVRSRSEYEEWYPTFGRSGLVASTWPREYGGLGLEADGGRIVEEVLRPYNLGRLNPLGLNLAAPALFAHGTERQRLRFLPPIVRNEEVWCQLFSEPGAGSDLASLATRAERDGDEWVVNGQKVWTTWAHLANFAVLLARTDPAVPKRKGLTYFLIDLDQSGVTIRPLRHLGGDAEFNEVFLDGARVPDDQRVGQTGEGWTVANATLSGERQMVAGSGSGGVDRIGGSGARHLIELAKATTNGDPELPGGSRARDSVVALYCEERVREWTNLRVRASARSGRPLGPASSIGKVHQGDLNQRMQLTAADLLGMGATAWARESGYGGDGGYGGDADYSVSMPYEVRGMLRSRANTIEGGTTEVNKNILGERVLGLPREPDPWSGLPWNEVPRS